tara:strand:+ start:3578 stop:3751 length:174 start_codon:yes stop_codon:yes gene_type:complete
MKDSGYNQAMKDKFSGMIKTVIKRKNRTDEESKRAGEVRRRREDIEEAISIDNFFKL